MTQALFPRTKKRHAASLRFTSSGPSGGLEVALRRRFGRSFAVGAALEWIYPHAGYGSVVSLAQSIEIAYWIPETFRGVHFAARVIVAEYGFVKSPSRVSVALGGDVVVGWSWWLPFDLSLDVSAGVRALGAVLDDPSICTRAGQCRYLRGDWLPRVEIGLGYLF